MRTNHSAPLHDQDFAMPSQMWAILLISILGLFLETLFIRWVGTEIRIFAYLQNTILVVCFLGLGLGMFTASRPILLKHSLIPLMILLFLMAIPVSRAGLAGISIMLASLGDLAIWSTGETSEGYRQILLVLLGLTLTYCVLILTVDIFVPLGRILGRLMNVSSRPILAYSINIVGSIAGTWLFVLLSYFYLPPFAWFLVTAALLAAFVLWSRHDRTLNLALLALTVVLSWFAGQVPGAREVIWSPYQKLAVFENVGLEDFWITVNNTGYQVIMDLSEERLAADPRTFPLELNGLSQYDIPLLVHPDPKSMLIVGAGSGNDAAGGLRHGVESITAVDIDPAILALGRDLHPERPYSSPRVQVVNDDARSFFATTDDMYDVIAFGLLDSHTTTALTTARLDNYVYTREGLLAARSRLAEGGVMVLTFSPQYSFVADRIELQLEQTFNQQPIVFHIPANSYGVGGIMFITGDLANVQKQLDQNPTLAAYIKRLQATDPVPLLGNTRITTDDWPYLYLESPRIPILYFLLMGLIVLILARSYRKWEARNRVRIRSRAFWHFFFLGSAFLLLEVQNISKASVVLGNTWQVNTVIITGILLMALLANWIAYRFPTLPLPPVYFLLIGTCLALYYVDLARFAALPYFAKAIIIGPLTSLPMLFSGIVFVRSFSTSNERSNALGANLIGALVGALLLSITFITGIKALLLVVAGLYLLSLLSMPVKAEARVGVAGEISD